MAKQFAGKRIVVGVTGSIAAFKVVGWVSALAKEEARVSVIMTQSAQKFIAPLTFAALTGEKVYTAMFDDDMNEAMAHIELAQEAALFLIAPASAQTIARLAHGMADDLLGAAVLATRAPVIVCPAMNSRMFLHQATQENLRKLKQFGYIVVDPESGMMACKDDGPGRLVQWQSAQEVVLRCLSRQDLAGEKAVVTAGPTREALDPARFISNRSSGKMGYALAREVYRRGAEVVLVSGPTALACPHGVHRTMVISAREMYEEVMKAVSDATIVIKAAAVSDFRPKHYSSRKVKKDTAQNTIELRHNPDILYDIGHLRDNKKRFIMGFAAESDNLEAQARKKLERKQLDLIAVNDISSKDAGFAVDTNKVTLLDAHHSTTLPQTSKTATAAMIVDHICALLGTGNAEHTPQP